MTFIDRVCDGFVMSFIIGIAMGIAFGFGSFIWAASEPIYTGVVHEQHKR